ncbi:DUF6763 family protein [Kaarinaea lacus]
MSNEFDPILANWYRHLDKGQLFRVVAIDDSNGVIEIQNFDGDVDEIEISQWQDLDIEMAEEPENFSGPYDVGELDDYGTEITDTSRADWEEPYEEIKTDQRR